MRHNGYRSIMGDKLKNWFHQKLREDSPDSEDPPTLSEVLKIKKYFTEQEIDAFCEYANTLQDKDHLTEEEEAWIFDFVRNIRRVIASDRELNAQVRERAAGTSTFKPTQTTTIEEQPLIDVSKPAPPPPPPRNLAVPTTMDDAAEVPTIELNKLVHKPEKFLGEREKARSWLKDYEAAIRANRWTHRIAVTYFSTFLGKQAKNWFLTMVHPKVERGTEWEDIREQFVRFYFGPDEAETASDQLRLAKQNKDELCTDFIPRILHLMWLAKVDLSEAEKARELKIKLRNEYQDLLIGKRPRTITELNDLCLEIEARLALRTSSKEPNRGNSRANNKGYGNRFRSSNAVSPSAKRPANEGDKNKQPFCTYCKKINHTVDNCFLKKANETKPDKKKKAAATVGNSNSQSTADAQSKPEVITLKNVCSVVASACAPPSAITHPVQLNGRPYTAMIDCGSEVSIVRTEVASQLQCAGDGANLNIVGADGSPLRCAGNVNLELALVIGTTKIVTTKFAVVDNLCTEVLLGRQLLGWLNVLVSMASKEICYEDEKPGMRTATNAMIPARTEAAIATTVPPQECGKAI